VARAKKGVYVNEYRQKDGGKIPYLRISAGPQRDRYVHRMIAEALLRRPLTADETVDHQNQNSLDCDPRNLQVLSWSDHGKVTREREKKGHTEGIDYVVILDGKKVFQDDATAIVEGRVPGTTVETLRESEV
jgi:hypothetical protein